MSKGSSSDKDLGAGAGARRPGRNDPCDCGSGRKWKLCCGALAVRVAAVAPQVQQVHAAAPKLHATRSCGTCTRCCDGWLEGEVRGHRMFPGQRCHFVADSGCTIYADRPHSPCRSFVCGWMQPASTLPDDWRPDRIGVIVVDIQWRGAPARILVSAGNDPGEPVLEGLRANAQATRTPFFYEQGGERYGYGPPDFQHEMAQRVARGEKLW